MSLNFQFTDKERFNKLTKEEKQQNDCFIWWAMLYDLREITEKNIDEWLWRIKFATKINGPTYNKADGTPYIPTKKEIEKRIGLTTNADKKTRNQFIAKQIRFYNK